MFLAGRFQDSTKLPKVENIWLEGFVRSYFKNIDHFPYSSIKTDPYELFIENIIDIPTYYAATHFGSKVHTALANIS